MTRFNVFLAAWLLAPVWCAVTLHVWRRYRNTPSLRLQVRAQGSLAGALAVSLRTGWHAAENERYIAHLGRPLAPATDDTRILTTAALRLVDTLYRPGYAYAKAGVLLSELCPRRPRQPDLFAAPGPSPASARLMQTLDGINARWGRDTLRLAAEGTTQAWQMKRAHLSPRYTTDWKGLPAVRAG